MLNVKPPLTCQTIYYFDSVPFLAKSTTCLPIAVIEVGNANRYSVDNKENQATAYAINVANCQFPAFRKFGLFVLALTYHKGGSISL
jgi:hypothetical protein